VALLRVELLRQIEALEREGAAHDAAEPERRRKRLNLERPAGELLHLLLRATGRKRVLEIGTSNGISTLWIQAALRVTGGTLVTVDREPAKQDEARRNLSAARLIEGVTFLAGDATEVVRGLPGPFDAVFFDADRVSAPEQLALLLPRLEPDVLLVSDNVLSHPAEVAAYLAACDALSGFASSSCPWERVYTSRTGRHADRAARPDKIPSPPSSAGRSSRLRFKGLGAARTSQGLDLAIRRALDLEGRRRCPGLVKRLRLRVS